MKRLLYETGIEKIEENAFDRYPQLEEIIIEDSPALKTIDAKAFTKLERLAKLRISGCKKLTEINGSFFFNRTRILSLSLENNALTEMPTFKMTNQHQTIEEINFSRNKIKHLRKNTLEDVDAVYVDLSDNQIEAVDNDAFARCKFLKLDMSDNLKLYDLPKDVFAKVSVIRKLDLSRTRIASLPTNGLKELETLVVEGATELKKLPPILAFTSLRNVKLTYAHHCCLFKHASKEVEDNGEHYSQNIEDIKNQLCRRVLSYDNKRRKRHVVQTTPVSHYGWHGLFGFFDDSESDDKSGTIEVDDNIMELLPVFEANDVGSTTYINCTKNAVNEFYASVHCSPMPNALNPCENVVGYQPLRYAIWFIWIAAILGNVGVWIVLMKLKQKRMRVHYFFMANLSTADLLTGVYLGMLAVEDVRTSDEYYNYAVEWQTGFGCKIAGFISVFASELSILSMLLIAFEMWYNVRYAFYGRRFKERVAYFSIGFVYLFSLTVAVLPIFGISSYSGTSVCLPLTIDNVTDKVFIMFGLLFNLIAFLGMVFCYISIVKMLLNPDQPSRPEDNAVIAKMALLIFTDMLCWFPTLFFGITASMNVPLISISIAKIFLVFFYPINAFANPFLYVFFTKVVQNRLKPCLTSCLKRLSHPTFRSERTNSTLLNFYHIQPPNGDRKDVDTQRLLQGSPTPNYDCTPRGSSASSNQKTVTSIISGVLPRNSLSSVIPAFEDPVKTDNEMYVVKNRDKTFIVTYPRISTAPDMSDISENSLSEDQTITKNNQNRLKKPVIVPQTKIDDELCGTQPTKAQALENELKAKLLINLPDLFE